MNNLSTIKTAYFIGIKGVGMSGLALIAKGIGMDVHGSDTDGHFITDETLQQAGIEYFTSFGESNIEKTLKDKDPGSVLVVVTAAHQGMNNREAVEAKKRGYAVMTYGEALGVFMSGKKGISVAGTHGKTTTTALIAHILEKAGKDPSYLVGTSVVPSLGNAAKYGKGDYFIAEADEYVADPEFLKTPKLLFQHPHIAVITSIDWDHPDVFDSREDIEHVFTAFVRGMPTNGIVIVDGDNEGVQAILPKLDRTVVTYGVHTAHGAKISRVSATGQGMHFILTNSAGQYDVSVPLYGEHNVKNAVAAIVACSFAGVSVEQSVSSLSSFQGAKRRFEHIGMIGTLGLYDDYAHHPEEIKATLAACRAVSGGSRIIAVFQPHTFSRTLALLDEFADSFDQADIVAVTDIFASGREAYTPLVTGERLAEKIRERGKDVYFVKNAEEFVAKVGPKLQRNDILITMGAGDIYTWHKDFKALLGHHEGTK